MYNISVGDNAVSKGKLYPENAVFAIKRRLESPDFRQFIPSLGRSLGCEDIVADIFEWIKNEVEKKFGGQVIDGVVISVPFAFQNRERKRIERAAQKAGLHVLGLLEEPVAAALSFGIVDQAERGKQEKILVFDLGGGTFDVTIFEFQKQSNHQFTIRVITTDGAKNLGGIDIDNMLVDKVHAKLNAQYPAYRLDTRDPGLQEKETFKIRQLAIETKELLSNDEEADFFFESSLSEEFCLDEIIEREELDDWMRSFRTQVTDVLDSALLDADLEPKHIDRVIMVGGTSVIPSINKLVQNYFGKVPEHVRQLNLMVGEGAGVYCGLKYVDKSLDCKISVGVSQDIGIKWRGKFIEMIPRNTLYGTPSELKILSFPKNGQKSAIIPIVQGNKINNKTVASVEVPVEIQQKLENGKLGIKLNTDVNNGTICYELYHVLVKNNQEEIGVLLKADKAGEE